MKIINVDELKDPNCKAPFYAILDDTKKYEDDPRACGCASQAILNAVLILKERLQIENSKSSHDELLEIQELTREKENSVKIEALIGYIDGHPIFDTCRILVMNPNGMNEEIFFRIFLNRLSQGHIALVVMESPDQAGSVANDRVNHISFIHSENGEVYFDGLRADLNFLIRAFYYSRPTTLLFFALNPGTQDER